MATVAQMGARALRKTGLTPVALADHPSAGSVVTQAVIAARALRSLGINPVAEADASANSGTATAAEVGLMALHRLGLSPVIADDRPTDGTVVSVASVAERALRLLGVNPVDEADASANSGTATAAQVGAMALHRLGLSPVVAADRPAAGTDTTVAAIAERALRLLGVNPVDEADTPANSGTTTVAAIALRALQRLAVVAADETPAAADTTLAEQKVAAVHEMLVANSFVTWASSVVPIAASEHYTVLTAGLLAPAFGMTFDAAEAKAAADGIRAIALAGAGGQALAETEVNAAHQALNAQGLVTWETSAIPPSVAAHYALMAATRLAPVYGREMSEDGYTGAMGLVRRVVISGATGGDLAEEKVVSAHQTLAALGFITWASGAIPLYAADYYAIIAANLLAPVIGMPADDAALQSAQDALRKIALSGSGGQALAEIEVNAAHQVLNAQGFVTWETTSIPPSVAAHYALMVATRLAPVYGRQMPEDGYTGAMGLIRRIILSGTTGDNLAEDKAIAAHEMLAASGIVTWSSTTIPLYATDHYAVMAAHMLAPTIGMAGDAAAFQAAQDALRVLALSGAAGQALAEAEVTAAHQTLNGLGYVSWAITAVPESVASHYATMTAVRLAPAFGRAASEDVYANAVGLVRRIIMSGATGQAMAEEKIRAAHASLDARGLTRWTLTTVPDYVEEPLVMIAAEMLAPEVGQPAMPGLALAGEREIRRVIALPTAGGAVKAAYF